MDVGTLTGEITLDDQMSAALARVNTLLDRFGTNADIAMRKAQSSMTMAAGVGSFLGTTLANMGMQALAWGKNLVTSSLMAGARLEQLGVATRFLGEKAGYSNQYIDDLAKNIQKTGISGISTRESILQLLGANIDLTNAAKLSAIAQNMQSLSGRSSSEVFQIMTRAIATGNTEILRNIGFQNVSIETLKRANKGVEGFGRTLTGAQRSTLIMNAIMAEGAEKAGLYGQSMTTAGKQASSAERAWEEVSEQIGTILLPITSVAIKSWYALGSAIRDSVMGSQAAVASTMQSIAAGLQIAITKTGEFVSTSVVVGKKVYDAYQGIPEVFKILGQNAFLAATGVWALNAAMATTAGTKLAFALTVLSQRIAIWGIAHGVSLTVMVLWEAAVLRATAVTRAFWAVIVAHPFAAIAVALGAATLALTSWYEASTKAKLSAEVLAHQTERITTAIAAGAPKTIKYAEAIEFLNEKYRRASGGALTLDEALNKVRDRSGHSYTNLRELELTTAKLAKTGKLPTPIMLEVAAAIKQLGVEAKDLPPNLASINAAFNKVIAPADAMRTRLISLREEALKPLTAAQKEYAGEADKYGDTVDEIVTATGGGERAIKKFLDSMSAIKSLSKSFSEAGQEGRVFTAVFKSLSAEQLKNADVQALLIPQIEALVNVNKAISPAMRKVYDDIQANRQALMAQGRTTIEGRGITIDYIAAQKNLGESEQATATRLGVSIDQYKSYITQLEGVRKVTDDLAAAQNALWSQQTAGQIKMLPLQEAVEQRTVMTTFEQGGIKPEAAAAAQFEIAERFAAQRFALEKSLIDQAQQVEVQALTQRVQRGEQFYATGAQQAQAYADIIVRHEQARTELFETEIDRRAKASSDADLTIIMAQKTAAEQAMELSMTTTQFQIAQIEKRRDAQIAAFQGMPEQRQAFTVAVTGVAQRQIDALTRDVDALRSSSATTLKEIADHAENTYQQALVSVGKYGAAAVQVFENVRDVAMNRLRGTLAGIDADWQALSDNSVENLQAIAVKARNTYEIAKTASGGYRTAAVEHFGDIAKAAEKAARGMGRNWDELVSSLKQSSNQLSDLTVGSLGSLLFGFGSDASGELKRAAEKAHQTYLFIRDSGKATAEALTTAFQRWREAEDRANNTFGERFGQLWRNMKSVFVSILDDMLEYFTKRFLVGVIEGIAGARLGQKLGAALGGSGGSGGLGNVAGNVSLGQKVAGWFGLGSGGVAAGSGAGMFAGTTLAGGAASLPIAPAVAGISAGTGAGGGAGAAGLGGMSLSTGLATAGIGTAAALLYWGIKNKGLFRGGAEHFINKRRDQFQLQLGGPPVSKGGSVMAAKLASWGSGFLFDTMQRARKKNQYDPAQSAIVASFAAHGQQLKSYEYGGFTPPHTTELALLHGGQRGEAHIPGGMLGNTVNQYITIEGGVLDAGTVTKIFREHLIRLLKEALKLNTSGLREATAEVVG